MNGTQTSIRLIKILLSGVIWMALLSSLLITCSKKKEEIKQDMHPSILKQEFIFSTDQAPTPQCHASTISETENTILAAWFGGTEEKNKDVGIWLSRNEGLAWSKPVEVVNGIQADGTRLPCWNPVLFQPSEGPLMLFYKVGPDPEEWWGMLVTSVDGGKNWSKPVKLPDNMLGPIKNKPVELAEGTILCPSSREDAGWTVHVERTNIKAENWESSGKLNDPEKFGAIQPTILTYPDNRLQILCRTGNSVISQCWSQDNGLTWSDMTATGLPNPNSGIDAVTLTDGRQLLVYNPTDKNWGDRVPLSIAISSDGLSWKKIFDLEQVTNPDTANEEEYSYPAVIQAANGLVHIVYTFNRRTVKHVVLDPQNL